MNYNFVHRNMKSRRADFVLLGPLMYYHEGRATLVGVTSTGDGCGKDRFPGIFARVTSVMDWINEELALNCSDFDETSAEN